MGRQPALGVAELESIYGAGHVRRLPAAALLDLDVNDINFKRLGGTIKLAKVLTILPTTKWPQLEKYLVQTVPEHLKYLPEGKFTLGLSVYDLNVSPKTINDCLLRLKKVIKGAGRPARVIPNQRPALSSAQVLHNKLTSKGAWELLFVRDGQRTILAQTMFVQDIEAYAARDQARPKRDARIGMLPPKLAQIMINLAAPAAKSKKQKAIRILDPFCGTGVILQEALLMGFEVAGLDIDQRMIDYSRQNLQWLVTQNPHIQGSVALDVADATKDPLPSFSAIASEIYLGKPLSKLPPPDELEQIINGCNDLLEKFLANLAKQQPLVKRQTKRQICLAVPAWHQPDGNFIHLPLLAKLTDMGYTRLSFKHVTNDELIYFRQDQTVARELLVLRRQE